ncbi:Asp-tRNA(Asn)/Glu-tRNA(Gln) amidotransferase subunit GatC [bacterium]|nr:Asp-tRNA(Asn)/Glu-tRNA(Gln) amidotransferase subunit GatC [bacterium]MCI0565990.1 Asp-tRNA(Asn)/Glu-tRNA(Gln) amidotransferase subunit GatC [bacterium]MCI0679754.1 Asp-tRNA(Asn)/Glu-tRNA(Gln) amidotransferase subunit GatC [bacterium]
MITRKEIDHLAELARIDVSEKDRDSLTDDLESILAYVSEINTLHIGEKTGSPIERHLNVMRPDGEPHVPGLFSEDILREAPETEEGYFKVQKILP